jgi:quinol monooxygenase YgiN
MIYELATLEVNPQGAKAFEQAIEQAIPHFRTAPGCRSFRLDRSVDSPGRYFLFVGWDSVDAHMVDFRSSPAFQAWRSLAGPFFVKPPVVDHVETAIDGF